MVAPLVGRGQVVGLLGGSFDPPHAGHVQASLEAMLEHFTHKKTIMVNMG